MRNNMHFKPMSARIGFYPVVPTADWVQRALSAGARTVQLRFKTHTEPGLNPAQQVRAAVQAGRAVAGAQVIINDYWELALAEGAYGVHLGQEDWAGLSPAQREALRASGMRLGLSTHTPEELALAKAANPSYLAIGPVYPTSLKVMPYAPVGLERLAQWVQAAAPFPVVAIGGISLERVADVMACRVGGVAVVSAVTQAADSDTAIQNGLQLCAQAR
jgi:thiamine-phosphate pyrophosphorylase/hydroxymethylpyrimidine kinase/phosphomethylpyrimidine kinase/thiamine-phosphate diphosphorylase